MNKSLIVLIVVLFISNEMNAQLKITWQDLSNVTWTDKYSAEVDANYYYPSFGQDVIALEGQEVSIKGFILPVDPESNFYVLSKNPFASCFFCGNAGPETIMQLNLKPDQPIMEMDDTYTFKGILKLNKDDIYQCNYILDQAEVVK